MSDPVPALSETRATGEAAAIFADIRSVLAVDAVNLIWRHLAMIPGALEFAWSTLRPIYADGTIAAQAAALHDELDLPRVPVFPASVLAVAGLSGEDTRMICNVLAAYDRTNAMALIALTALQQWLDDGPLARTADPSHGGGPSHQTAPRNPLPTLPDLAGLRPHVAQLVTTLNRLGTRREQPILASMYRHLAYWPTYLALMWAIIAPLEADGSLARSIADALAKASKRSALALPRLRARSDVPIEPALGAAIRTAIEPFTGDVIAKMVVICAVLRAITSGS
jgi:hypothetical protein